MFDTTNKKIMVVVVLVIGFLGYWFVRSTTSSPTRSVTTVGVGKKQVPADKATITFTISQSGVDQTSLAKSGETKINAALQAVAGLSPTDVRKTAYQISPVSTGGYQYAIGAQVTVTALNIEPTVQALTSQGANIASLRYNTANESGVGAEVREMAIKDARTRAEQIAKASGARVGKVLVVTEQGATDQTGSTITGTKAGLDSASFNEVEVQSTLNVTFELK